MCPSAEQSAPFFVDLVGGARPNFMKLAPVLKALQKNERIQSRLIHTGQHYDAAMSEVFFAELEIPTPDVFLDVGSGPHGAQTARILERYEAHLLKSRPAATVVFGDVNSTVACALAAVKLGIPVVHVEAGLRSFDRTMPEEINRILTDSISDLLLVTEPSGVENLMREGVPEERIRLLGNTMIDTLRSQLPAARERQKARALGLDNDEYGVVTLHRPANVDDPEILGRLLVLLAGLSIRLPLVFPVHPRTSAAIDRLEEGDEFRSIPTLHLLEPQPYLDNLSLMSSARVVLTDSGGIQEECAVLGVPCITLRENTERPVTVEVGASRLVGSDAEAIRSAFDAALLGHWGSVATIDLWDGHAGDRMAEAIATWLEGAASVAVSD